MQAPVPCPQEILNADELKIFLIEFTVIDQLFKKVSKVDFIFLALTRDIFGKIRLICLILSPLYEFLCF